MSFDNDPGTEAEALSDWLEGADPYAFEDEGERHERLREENALHRLQRRTSPSQKYQAARAARVGSQIKCAGPGCRKHFIKRSYQQCFCSNKGRGNCKDAYWNL